MARKKKATARDDALSPPDTHEVATMPDNPATHKTKPFGRQIAGLKDQARGALGEGATPEALADKANELAAGLSWDYTFTPESFTGKKKAGTGKRGRPPGSKNAAAPVTGRPSGYTPFVSSNLAATITGLRQIINEVGKEEAKRIIDALA